MAQVSILMNGYNAEQYLNEAIDSIYAQTFNDWEIIFIDNCSTDQTKNIVMGYDDKIKYYATSSNLPLGAARNFGLSFCHGEYIAFLDTDDIWLPNKLEEQIRMMDKYKEYILCYTGVIYIDQFGKQTGRMLPRALSGNVFPIQLKRYEINMQSVLLRNNYEIRFNKDLKHSPDFDLFLPLTANHLIAVIETPLVKYRRLSNSLTSKNIAVWWSEMQYTLDKLFHNNKLLSEQYPKEIQLAYAKVAYNKAKYFASQNQWSKVRQELKRYSHTSLTYFMIYLIAFSPYLFNKIFFQKDK